MDKQQPQQDRHLETPGEANRDKHINFQALESGDPDPADDDSGKLYSSENSTLQTPEEEELDKNRPASENDDHIRVSNDDIHETPADRRAGSDRAGTSERKE
jgi:hypothetical protein